MWQKVLNCAWKTAEWNVSVFLNNKGQVAEITVHKHKSVPA